jgi:hypothetical protein
MNQKENLRDAANTRGKSFLEKHDEQLHPNPSYVILKARFDQEYELIQKAKQKQFVRTGNTTYQKRVVKNRMIDIFMPCLDAGSVQLFLDENYSLSKELDKEQSLSGAL